MPVCISFLYFLSLSVSFCCGEFSDTPLLMCLWLCLFCYLSCLFTSHCSHTQLSLLLLREGCMQYFCEYCMHRELCYPLSSLFIVEKSLRQFSLPHCQTENAHTHSWRMVELVENSFSSLQLSCHLLPSIKFLLMKILLLMQLLCFGE